MLSFATWIVLSAPVPASLAPQSPQTPAKDAAPANPFQPDEALRKLLGDGDAKRDDGFTPLDEAPSLPAMRVKAIVQMRSRGKPAAVVEVVDVGTYTVREGERLSFSMPGRAMTQSPLQPRAARDSRAPATSSSPLAVRQQIPIVLRIDKIAPDGVVVEVGTLGELLIIR